jgi:hypothetical protein
MRRKVLVVAGIFVVLVVLILLLNLQPAPPPHVEMGFYGFTNSGARVEALFGISNHPNLSVVLHSVSRLGTNAPKPDDESMGSWDWGRWEPWGIISAVNVKTTNEPLRVVFEFQDVRSGCDEFLRA